MTIALPQPWPETAEEALVQESRLRRRLDLVDRGPTRIATAAGFDAAYDARSGTVAGAVVVMAAVTGEVLQRATCVVPVTYPYVPGFLALRELPALASAWNALDGCPPGLLLCDGHGVAHPRRFGLACWVGVLTDLPTVGVAKTRFIGEYPQPAPHRGSSTPVRADGEVIGRALRTRDGVKEVLVSVGHRLDLDRACAHVLALSSRYRLPEPLRAADHAARRALSDASR